LVSAAVVGGDAFSKARPLPPLCPSLRSSAPLSQERHPQLRVSASWKWSDASCEEPAALRRPAPRTQPSAPRRAPRQPTEPCGPFLHGDEVADERLKAPASPILRSHQCPVPLGRPVVSQALGVLMPLGSGLDYPCGVGADGSGGPLAVRRCPPRVRPLRGPMFLRSSRNPFWERGAPARRGLTLLRRPPLRQRLIGAHVGPSRGNRTCVRFRPYTPPPTRVLGGGRLNPGYQGPTKIRRRAT
jgi:hypothetical protein